MSFTRKDLLKAGAAITVTQITVGLFSSGCGPEDSNQPPGTDGGTGGSHDGGTTDGGKVETQDSGTQSMQDSGTGTPDAGMDAGTSSPPDAGVDAGTKFDAGTTADAGSDAGTAACGNGAVNQPINDPTHGVSIPAADIVAGAQKVYSIQGTSMHNHNITVTAAMFTLLRAGMTFTVTSTMTNGHTHNVTVRCRP